MVSLNEYLTASNKYPDRKNKATEEVINNAKVLISKVNQLLFDLKFDGITVSSGFRPPEVNASIGGAKKSLHMTGKAIDISGNKLSDAIKKNPSLLKKYGLWMEDPASTPGWTHIDMGERTDRPVRIFKP